MAGVPQQKQRVFSGVVSKMHDTFGFVDEDIFFQLSACEGGIPSVGDRVIVEAQFNPSMPFKWNASRVQIDQQQVTPLQAAAPFGFQGGAARGAQQSRTQQQHLYAMQNQALGYAQPGRGGAGILGPAPVNVLNSHMPQQRQPMSGGKGHKRNAPQRSGGRDRRPSPRRGADRNRSRDEPPRKKRSKTPPPRKRSLSPSSHRRSISIDKSARRPAPRYMVQYVKYPLNRKSSDVLALRNVFTNMYIPSDFFNVDYKWQDCFPMQQPVSVEKCHFHVFHKDVEPLEPVGVDMLDPPDADHSWTARVMLMQLPGLNETYKQCCSLAEDESPNFQHPHRLYKFLVGYKGKKEPMAVGGLWSPSLDGPDPAKNPLTLIKTAVRTCKALTGIDLSKCSKWYRILEIRYHRNAEMRKGREVPDRVETTVIYLPDVHSCMPTASEYAALRLRYLDKLEACLSDDRNTTEKEKIDSTTENKAPEDPNVSASEAAGASDDPPDQKDEDAPAMQEEVEGQKQNGALTSDINSEGAEQHADETKQTPSKSDIKTMKVGDLRKELDARGLSSKGLKAALVSRLAEAIEKESEEAEKKEEEEEEVMDTDAEQGADASAVAADIDNTKVEEVQESEKDDNQEEKAVKEEEEKTTDEKQEEKAEIKEEKKKVDKERVRRHYMLPESQPAIPVHPNATYKKGVFGCSTASLSNLLGYRQEDNKESIFEVSVFAEAFKEMLQRGFAFTIYQALKNPMPELQKEKEDEVEGEEEKKRKAKSEEDEEPKSKKAKSESDEPEQEEKTESKEKSDDATRSHSQDGKSNGKDNQNDNKEKGRSDYPAKTKNHTEKSVTVRRDLLLAFVYFDHTHCGFIKGPDLSDIIHSIGLGLSRSQISKLTSRYLDHDTLHYRKLTDVPASRVPEFRVLLEKTNKEVNIDSLLLGNKSLLTATLNDKQDTVSSDTPVLKSGLALYNGVVVDVGLLQTKLKSSEDTRVELESALETVKDELDSTGKQLSKAQKDYKSLESDYEASKKKLVETQTNFKSAADVKSKYEKALKSIVLTAENVLPKAVVAEAEK